MVVLHSLGSEEMPRLSIQELNYGKRRKRGESKWAHRIKTRLAPFPSLAKAGRLAAKPIASASGSMPIELGGAAGQLHTLRKTAVPIFPMNAFAEASKVEQIARAELLPWLRLRSQEVEEVPPGLFLQKLAGDFIVTHAAKQYGIELKAEEKHTGNLFLEVWSNRPEMTFGWLWTSRADWLFYYFTDSKVLYIVDFPALQKWAYEGGVYKYPERPQSKYDQLNMTYGRCVPIVDIQAARVPMKRLSADDRRQ